MTDNLIGKRLDGRYLIQSLIGSGGMANVYKAGDLKENRLVAVKILRQECMENEDLVRRFKNESKAISVLNHPNIVKVYDVSVSERLQYIVMEYIDGITLKDYMEFRKQPLTYKETIHFVTQTLLALQHAHAKGIVHRDIKPQNIMLLQNGSIKVMDFGIARFSRSENQTMTDKAIGSVHYISPEQAKGDVTDPKSDIYSAGVMMYEMLAGRLPFDGDSPVGVAIKQISDAATPLRTVNPSVPEGLASITERAMAKDPRERYQSAGAMLTDIEAFKRNPSIQFAYKYLADTSPTRYINKATGHPAQRAAQPSTRPGAAAETKGKSKLNSRFAVMLKKKYALPILAGMAGAFALISIVICLLLFKDNPLFTKKADVELPNFANMTKEEVEASEYMKTFDITFQEAYNVDFAQGVVYDQSPKPPKTVKEGASILLRVSLGTQSVPVPDVLGQDKASAMQILKEAGFNVMGKKAEVEAEPFNVVQKLTKTDGTEITSGMVMDTGTTILVYITTEKRDDKVKVPDCRNISKDDAKTLMDSVGLVIGQIIELPNDLAVGTVIEQNPAPDTEVTRGSMVILTISSGHEHNFVETGRTPPNCTTPGYVTYTCAFDGETKTEEYTPATPNDPNAHTYDPTTHLCIRDGVRDPAFPVSSSGSTSSSSGGNGGNSGEGAGGGGAAGGGNGAATGGNSPAGGT